MVTIEKLQEEIKNDKGCLVLDFAEVVRLLDVCFDEGENEFFFMYEHLEDGEYWSSVLVGYTPLKGRLTNEEYERLDAIWKLNKDCLRKE